MDRSRQLAQFLRARREQIKPEEVGISVGVRRRVPGLRREELATLAGLSPDYYTRLEQGRGHRPSEELLEALARALRLDDDATAHLFVLGRALPPAASPDRAGRESVRPDLQDLLDALTTVPALIHGRWLDVLASNRLARALTPFADPGTNMVRSAFLNPEVRARSPDPDWAAATAVAYLRAHVGGDADDPELNRLVADLSQASEDFRRMWGRHDVLSALSGDTPFLHPVVGALHVRYQTFAVHGADRQTLFLISTAPGTPDAQALARLASLTPDLDRSSTMPEPLTSEHA